MRKPSPTDYTIELPGVGSFVFARRTQGDKLQIRRLYSALVGDSNDRILDFLAYIHARYAVLMVKCPEGWEDLNALPDEGEDGDRYSKAIADLGIALDAKEDSFRGGPGERAPGDRPGDVDADDVLVQETV